MTRSQQRDSELTAWHDYAQLSGWVSPVDLGPDPPDLVSAHAILGRVGIEVVEYFQDTPARKGSKLAARDCHWQAISALVDERRAQEGRHLDVSMEVFFDAGPLPGTHEIAAFIDDLFAIAEAAEPERRILRQRDFAHLAVAGRYCREIYLHRTGVFTHWDRAPDVIGVGTADEHLSRIIERKLVNRAWQPGFGHRILLLAGSGRGAGVVGIWRDLQLRSLSRTSLELAASGFDEFGCIAEKAFRWRRGQGWEWLGR